MTAILIVEDEAKTAETVRLYLERAGYEVALAADGRSGLAQARSGRFALVILDLMLPEIDGLTICSRLRQETDVRILMLTARATEQDRVKGLDLGADDYVTKPFSPRELVARVRAVLRRTDPSESGPRRLSHGGLALDLDARTAAVDGRQVDLTATEVRLLGALLRAPGRVFTRDELIDNALGTDYEGSDRTIDVHVRNLRNKIEPDRANPRFVETVFGVGYRLGTEDGTS